MDLNDARGIAFQMQGCFAKLKLPIHSETEQLNDERVPKHIEFSTIYTFGDAGDHKLAAKFYYLINMIELSLYLHLDYEEYKRSGIIHLLNFINNIRAEAHWSLCDCCNEIELRYAIKIEHTISEKYFKQMVKKTIYLGRSFCPLIISQIGSNGNPYELADHFFENNKDLTLTDYNVFQRDEQANYN